MKPDTSHLPIVHLRLPAQRHIPGTDSVAELEWLKEVTFLTPNHIDESHWRENLPYRYGWFLFHNLYFWEAHEVWEPVWLNAAVNSKERFLVQGLIQLANAELKGIQGNTRAESRLRNIASEHFDHAFSAIRIPNGSQSVMGVSLESLNSLM